MSPSSFQLMPEQASRLAAEVDALFWFFMAVCGGTGVAVFVLVAIFAFRYRRRPGAELPPKPGTSLGLEVAWSVFPLAVVLVLFVWGARIYVDMATPPERALEIFIAGRQWMWKAQHPTGVREINSLHVPVGQPVKLTLSSEDVIHSFFIPAFRIKRDVVPGTFTTIGFEATVPGTYHLFCAEYCGTEHSRMVGRIVALTQSDYQAWLGSAPTFTSPGRAIFERLGCPGCHEQPAAPRPKGPDLLGLYGAQRRLANGARLRVDEAYLRQAIVAPDAHVPWGWKQGSMPTYAGLLDEAGLVSLVGYLAALGASR